MARMFRSALAGRLLANGMGRPVRIPRSSIRLALSVAVVLSMTALVPLASATSNPAPIDLLFVQNAHRATLTSDHGVIRLNLHKVAPSTVFFSDRPQRVTGRMSNRMFVQDWTKGGKNSFANDPPNAALDGVFGGKPVIVIVELRHPRLRGHTLSYRITLVDKPTPGIDHLADSLGPAATRMERLLKRGRVVHLAEASLFIDDYTVAPPTTGFTGFFNQSQIPPIGTVLKTIPVTSALTLSCVAVTANTGGVLTGTVTLGIGSAANPLTATGTFTWTDANDWTLSIGTSAGATGQAGGAGDPCRSATSDSGPPTLSGTISDTKDNGLGGALTINTTVGTSQAPVSLALSYSGKTASFSGTVDGATLPSGATASVSLTATKGSGLSGSIELTDATLGQTKFPSLSLTFDTSTAAVAVAGTMKSDMGNFTMSASFAKNQFQSLSVTGADLNTAGGDKVGDATGEFEFTSFSFSVTNLPTTGCISFTTSNVQGDGEMGNDKFTFGPNSLTFTCGKVTAFVMNLSMSHTSGIETVTISGNLTYAAPSSTVKTLDGYGALPTINYTSGFFGSLSFEKGVRVSASKKVAGYNIKGSFGISGSVGFQVGIYQNQSPKYNYAVGFYGHLSGDAKIQRLHVDGSVELDCSWLSDGSDFTCGGQADWDLAGKHGHQTISGI